MDKKTNVEPQMTKNERSETACSIYTHYKIDVLAIGHYLPASESDYNEVHQCFGVKVAGIQILEASTAGPSPSC